MNYLKITDMEETKKTNKQVIIEKTNELLEQSYEAMKGKIERALACGAIDIDSYDGTYRLPKTILVALLTDEKDQYSLTKEERKEAENIYYCI